MRRRLRQVTGASLLAVLAVACGDSGEPERTAATQPTVATTTSTSTTTTTLPPTTTTTSPPVPGFTRNNPLPIGRTGVLFDPPWEITVLEVVPNANTLVARENQFNKPPEPGRQFFLARVRLEYYGPGAESPVSLDLEAVGPSNVIYRQSLDTCGVIPKPYSQSNRVFAGGVVEGNVCWSVKTEDVAALTMLAHRLFRESDVVWFKLQ